MTIWRMRIACWIPKATNTHSEYVNIYCFSSAKMVARTWLNMTLYVHCLSLLNVSVAVVPRENATVCCNTNKIKPRHTILCSETDIR